jgi:hypothetical protein
MMVKIGVIFMPFSNPPFHFRGTADFTCLQSLGGCVMSAVPLKWQVGFENDMKMTHVFTIISSSKMLI